MALYLPIRALNRSQQVRIARQKITATATAYVDISDLATRKEFAYHSAFGAVYVVGPTSSSKAPQKVWSGTTVTEGVSPTDMSIRVLVGELRKDDGVYVTVAQQDLTVGAADGTNPRWDIVVVDAAGTATIVAGVVSATPVLPDTPAGKTLLAKVTVAALDTGISNSEIADLRERW